MNQPQPIVAQPTTSAGRKDEPAAADRRPADDERRQEGRVADPAGAGDRQHDAREGDTDEVMADPAVRELAGNGLRFRNVVMPDAAAREMGEPAAGHRPVRLGEA